MTNRPRIPLRILVPFCAPLVLVSVAAALPPYLVHALTPPPATGIGLFAMNDFGQFVGFADQNAFVWTPNAPNSFVGTYHLLSSLGGFNDIAIGINDRGQIVGRSNSQPVVWSPGTPNGVPGEPVPLPFSMGEATAINASGQIVGCNRSANLQSFLWTPTVPNGTSGTVTNIGRLPGTVVGCASSINDYGQVAGWSNGAYLWQPSAPNATTGALQNLNLPQPTSGYQNRINDGGSITGDYVNQAQVSSFIWTPTSMHGTIGNSAIIPNLPGATSALVVTGINGAPQVVGYNQERAFIWTPDEGTLDLTSVLDASQTGWVVKNAFAINNLGHVLASATLNLPMGNPTYHTVILAPVPESVGVLSTAVVCILASCQWRRRTSRGCAGRTT